MYITEETIPVLAFLAAKPEPNCGASASFLGIVRNHHEERSVQGLFYDCYRPMADKEIAALIKEAQSRWKVQVVRVLHRIGRLQVGEVAVAIVVHAQHRREAFQVCRFMIDEIKQRVPIWKKEFFQDGTSQWVVCTHDEPRIVAQESAMVEKGR